MNDGLSEAIEDKPPNKTDNPIANQNFAFLDFTHFFTYCVTKGTTAVSIPDTTAGSGNVAV